ncbi:MAG: TIGR04053 family radical SAM/SPASM domain-containing protein [Pyrodictiaceae archaeon]
MASKWPFDEKPLLVFWETTKACLLACKHCRAEAIKEPLPGELSTSEVEKLVDQITEFGHPYPILILTGGDPLMRKDLWHIIDYAKSKGLRIGIAPSITPLLDENVLKALAEHGVSSISISLDSASPDIHDSIRGVKGTWRKTIEAIKTAINIGLRVQVNTVVMRSNVYELPYMVKLLRELGVETWEVFYLIPVGRAAKREDLTPSEWEDVSHFLYEASKYGLMIRTTEGPMFRRVTLIRNMLEEKNIDPDKLLGVGRLYYELKKKLKELLGEPKGKPRAHTVGTRDGKGIVFIAYNGDVYPSGFLPVSAGNIRRRSLVDIYRNSTLFRDLRKANFKGRCGRCEFRFICGGSRARAYAYYGDPLAEDPACPYKPGDYEKLLAGEQELKLN